MSSINPAGQCCSTGSKISSFSGGAVTPANGYVLENGTDFYVAEDNVTFYVQEV
jgi:hypothetical protein